MAGQWLSEWLCREEGLQWPAEELQEAFVEPCNSNGNSEEGLHWPAEEVSEVLVEEEPCNDNGNYDTSSIPMANKRSLNISSNNPSTCKSINAPSSNMKGSKVNFKLVLAEPLPDSPWSHVNTFLEAHGGPGLQVSGVKNITMSIQI